MLTDLDAAIGDGDHGINLARGLDAVMAKLPELEEQSVDMILKTAGMTLVSTVGGASGPLYGTAFLKAGSAITGKTVLHREDISSLFKAFIDGIQLRGKAVEGEKTMLDTIIPAERAYTEAINSEQSLTAALDAAEDAARTGVEHTKNLIATKGRASYLGERSLGHQDPGATSMLLLIESVCEVLKTRR